MKKVLESDVLKIIISILIAYFLLSIGNKTFSINVQLFGGSKLWILSLAFYLFAGIFSSISKDLNMDDAGAINLFYFAAKLGVELIIGLIIFGISKLIGLTLSYWILTVATIFVCELSSSTLSLDE